MNTHIIKIYFFLWLSSFAISCNINAVRSSRKVLVFTKTVEFHHTSIDDGIKMFEKLGHENNLSLTVSEDPSIFNDDSLKQFNAVVFLSTTGEILNYRQQLCFKRYIEAGGGFMGIHGSSASLSHSDWYRELVGAYFNNHTTIQKARLIVDKDKKFPVTKSLQVPWIFEDEWYNWEAIPENVNVLVSVDEASYHGGEHGKIHPLVWYHEYGGGKSFYMALGHTTESYSDPKFIGLVHDGINYVCNDTGLDYSRVKTPAPPEQNAFRKEMLVDNASVQEPMGLSISDDGRIFYIERRGNVRVYDIDSKQTSIIGTVPVYSEHEDGLLGIALDPGFSQNHWIYLFYSAPCNQFNYHLSRFRYDPETNHLIDTTEIVVLKIHQEHAYSNHTGGRLCFDKQGNLFITVGDNTIPFASKGYAPIDQRAGRTEYDAARSSGNTNDLRGKILRIHPEPDGSYTIPEGNLFPRGMAKTRPEIYVMGCRNPFSISIDPRTNFLYWGDVGPDAHKDSLEGPRGYDEVNQARRAGNFGWPFFVGNNKPYAEVDFSNKKVGNLFDPQAPQNNSPRNTGLKILPPVQNAFIWYPYAESQEFPWVESGGRTAMTGPVYYYVNDSLLSDQRLPEYYNGGLFIYDWVRNWIKVVRMDTNGNYTAMEEFMPEGHFSRIIDMQLGPDGMLYLLEYGNVWYQANPDAGISRINFYLRR